MYMLCCKSSHSSSSATAMVIAYIPFFMGFLGESLSLAEVAHT